MGEGHPITFHADMRHGAHEHVPKLCQRCQRQPPTELHLWHPSSGATMGLEHTRLSRTRWFARGWVCWACACVVNWRLGNGRLDRWLLRVRVVFVRGGS
jgi:hypothetical protein